MKYSTEQRKYLMSFLEAHRDKQYTMDELIDAVDANVLGKSTVYRLIKNMVDEGTVKTFATEGSRKASYQLDAHCNAHFHLKCESCGRLLHLDDKASDELGEIILKKYNFDIDEGRTMLYGKCSVCNKASD